MTVIAVPSHLDEPLPGLDLDVAPAHHLVTIRPGEGETWSRLAAIYDRVAETVAGVEGRPVVVSGDCTTAVGTITGLQRRGLDPGVVWIDAHGDLHTEQTTTSGYIGGMALAMVLGDEDRLVELIGLRPVNPSRVTLVAARDLEPAEQRRLQDGSIQLNPTLDLDQIPDGSLYLHVDIDICDPHEVDDLLYPADHGATFDQLLTAVGDIAAHHDLAAIGIAATWRHGTTRAAQHQRQLRRLIEAATPT